MAWRDERQRAVRGGGEMKRDWKFASRRKNHATRQAISSYIYTHRKTGTFWPMIFWSHYSIFSTETALKISRTIRKIAILICENEDETQCNAFGGFPKCDEQIFHHLPKFAWTNQTQIFIFSYHKDIMVKMAEIVVNYNFIQTGERKG